MSEISAFRILSPEYFLYTGGGSVREKGPEQRFLRLRDTQHRFYISGSGTLSFTSSSRSPDI